MSRELCSSFRENVVYVGASSPRGLVLRLRTVPLRNVGLARRPRQARVSESLEKSRSVSGSSLPKGVTVGEFLRRGGGGGVMCIHGEEGDVTSVTTTLQCLESTAARSAPGKSATLPPRGDAPENVHPV
uniref:Uncharacterized protein n=1 Tax=Molossus molossus TaxID=27622 RepID=A0A7J8FA27_MOLMO|nr:hypothetical protein HJG59_008537 [Molossus molossus]